MPRSDQNTGRLERQLGTPEAVLLGLGSILGTGVFVSLGLAAGAAGGLVLPAVALAALLALANGLSSAQLAASHPVSGGTYEYGYRYLVPAAGFTAGLAFLLAKSASAATAALGFAGYALEIVGLPALPRVPLALAAVLGVTLLVASGLGRSSRVNTVLVALTLAALTLFVAVGFARMPAGGAAAIWSWRPAAGGGSPWAGLFEAAALAFVAYTGYGRVATLGEEVRRPERTIPRAIVAVLAVSLVVYGAVVAAALAAVGPQAFAASTTGSAAPLAALAAQVGGHPAAVLAIALGAVVAMLGVLLNLVLGLSRVLLAMARRGDAPRLLARVDGASPRRAVWVTGIVVALLAATGSVAWTWSASAFTVLIYYALTNLAALNLPPESRRFPRWTAAAGLVGCLGLAFWVDPEVIAVGLVALAVGHGLRLGLGRRRSEA